MDIISFLEFDGKPPTQPVPIRDSPTLTLLRDEYLNVHRSSLEANTIAGMELHFKHPISILGEGYPIKQLDRAALQNFAFSGR